MASDTTVYLVGGVTFLIALYMFTRKKPTGNLPPGPRGVFLYGNARQKFRADEKGLGILSTWAKEFGDIYSIQLGSVPTIVLSGLETIKEAYHKHGETTSGRPNNLYLTKYILRAANYGVIMNEGQLWKSTRRSVIHSLRDFGMGKKSLEQRIQDEARSLVDYIGGLGKGPIDIRYSLHNAFSNIIVSIIFGERYEYGDPEFSRLSDMMLTLFKTRSLSPESVIPILFPLLPLLNPQLLSAIKARKEILRLISSKIQLHREQFDPDDVKCFLDIYIKAEQDGDFKDVDSERNLFFTIMHLFFAGAETSTTTTRWAIIYLMHYPEVQAKCQQIIVKEVGQEKLVTGADRDKMPYIDATINEVSRMASIAPYSVLHRVEKTTELSGFTLPEDTLIITNLHGLHMDPRYWKNPEVFNPERWLDADGNLVKHEAFMPFGTGPRECLGKNLAMQEMFIMIVTLLQRFTFKPADPDNLPPLSGSVGSVHIPPPHEVIIEKW